MKIKILVGISALGLAMFFVWFLNRHLDERVGMASSSYLSPSQSEMGNRSGKVERDRANSDLPSGKDGVDRRQSGVEEKIAPKALSDGLLNKSHDLEDPDRIERISKEIDQLKTLIDQGDLRGRLRRNELSREEQAQVGKVMAQILHLKAERIQLRMARLEERIGQ